MNRVLLINLDNLTAQRFGLRCLDRDIAVVMAESVSEGVRILATTPVSLIVADLGRHGLSPHEYAQMFEQVAPGVPVVATVAPDLPLMARVELQLAGFDVIPAPVEPEDLLKALPSI